MPSCGGIPRCHQRGHVENFADQGASGERSPASGLQPAVADDRRHSDEFRDLPSVQPPQFRQFGEHHRHRRDADSRARGQDVCRFRKLGALTDGGFHPVIDAPQLFFVEGDGFADDIGGFLVVHLGSTVPFRRNLTEDLVASMHESTQLFAHQRERSVQFGRCERSELSDHFRVDIVVFLECSAGAGELANAQRVGDRAVEAGIMKCVNVTRFARDGKQPQICKWSTDCTSEQN